MMIQMAGTFYQTRLLAALLSMSLAKKAEHPIGMIERRWRKHPDENFRKFFAPACAKMTSAAKNPRKLFWTLLDS
jgi:hypothetical protein